MNTIFTTKPSKFEFTSPLNLIKVDDLSKVPKFKQLIEIIKSNIKCGVFQIGEQIPSINETSAEFDVGRQTVERAYNVLKEKGILRAVHGKGFFVSSSGKFCSMRCLILINNFNEGKKVFYQAFINSIPEDSEINIQIFNGDPDQLERLIMSNLGYYEYYVIFPLLIRETENLCRAIDMIPKDKLILVHKEFENLAPLASIVQNCRKDIYESLTILREDTKKYDMFRLVIPRKNYYEDILKGFTEYCQENFLRYTINDSMYNIEATERDFFIVKEELDLVTLIKQCNKKGYQLGKEVGIISYEESPYKEIFSRGISTLTPDYGQMGKTLSQFIQNGSIKKYTNDFKIIKRNSI